MVAYKFEFAKIAKNIFIFQKFFIFNDFIQLSIYFSLLLLKYMSRPKGKIIVIGGAIDKGSFTESSFTDSVEGNLNQFERGILDRIVNESKNGIDSKIEIIPTASRIPLVVGNEYVKAFQYLGVKNANILNIRNRKEANSIETIN